MTDEGIKVRDVVAQEAVWPAAPPTEPIPPRGHREELPPWLVEGILEMEDIIKAGRPNMVHGKVGKKE